MEHHHMHHTPPLHWGYSATPPHHNNTWVPPQTRSGGLKRTISESDCEDLFSETSSSKDQTSPKDSDSCQHQSRKKRRGVIEKKRRDRINVSLIELKRLVPSAFEKQGSAKLEKAEILQLTVDHLKMLHAKGFAAIAYDPHRFAADYNNVGYRECVAEVARYLANVEGMDAQEPMRMRLLDHLQCNVSQREAAAAAAVAASSTVSAVGMGSSTGGSSSGVWPAPPPAPGASYPGAAASLQPPPPPSSASSSSSIAVHHQHHHHQQQQQQQLQQQQHHQQHHQTASASAHAPASAYPAYTHHHHQHQQHQQYSTSAASASAASTSSAASGGYVPNLSPSLIAQTAASQHSNAVHTSTATAATSTTSSTNTTASTTARTDQQLSAEENQQHQQQQHQHHQHQQQHLHHLQHPQQQQQLGHHYPSLIGADGHPIAPTYIDISQCHLRPTASDAAAGYVQYGAPGSTTASASTPAYANHPAYSGSKPYRPWGAEMVY